MNNTTERPIKWFTQNRYLGAFIADEGFLDMLGRTGILRTKTRVFHNHVPARPEKYYSVINRMLQALDVLRGRADALYWYEDFE